MTDKPYYEIDSENYRWVFELSKKEQQKAYKIWTIRLDNIIEASLKIFPSNLQLDRLWTEYYERLCAISYPLLFKWESCQISERYLYLMKGSFIIRQRGKNPILKLNLQSITK